MLEVAEADLELEAGLCPSGKARRACTAVKIARSSVEVFSQGQSVPDTTLSNQASVVGQQTRAVPAAKGERLLSVRSTDLRRSVRQ
jgi:hypothetical protein